MPELTNDELTVLLIASKGESMMPIGRWEAPVASLVAKGLLHAQDKFNNVITEAGRKALRNTEEDDVRHLVEVNNAVVEARQKASARADELATLLAELATYSSSVTGDDKVTALRNWAKIILGKALEMVK
jgi:hypothetical protein